MPESVAHLLSAPTAGAATETSKASAFAAVRDFLNQSDEDLDFGFWQRQNEWRDLGHQKSRRGHRTRGVDNLSRYWGWCGRLGSRYDSRGRTKVSIDYSHVESRVLDLAQRYSGKKVISLDQMLSKDLGIEGWEGIDIIQDLEEEFELDLDPLMQSVTWYLPPRWWDRLLGRTHGARVTDVKVRDLIAYVVEHAGEGMNEAIPRV